jgi:hypothetical protein
VEIDLAVGFRCTDDYLVKQQQGSFFSQILWSDQLLAWSKYYLIEHSSTAIAAGAWKQKLQAYAEQVIFVLLSSSLSFCWFIPMTWYSFGVDYFCWCHSAKKDVMRFLIYCSDVILLKNCIRQFLLIGSVQLLHGFYISRRWEFFITNFRFFSSEQATRRLLPETEKASWLSSRQCTCRELARAVSCTTSTTHKYCIFFKETGCKI